MVKIPPPTDTDSDDVAWAIQTAATQLERGDVDDAVVWLRRGAQAAAQADDDTRALELARVAAELAESSRTVGVDDVSAPPVSIELDPKSIREGIFTGRGPSAKAPPPPPAPARPVLAPFSTDDEDDEVVTSAPPMEQIAILRALSKTGPQPVVPAPAGLPPPPPRIDKPVPLDPVPVAVFSGLDLSDRRPRVEPHDVPAVPTVSATSAVATLPQGDEPTLPSPETSSGPTALAPESIPVVPASAVFDAEPTVETATAVDTNLQAESSAPELGAESTLTQNRGPELDAGDLPRAPDPSLVEVEPVSEDPPQQQREAANQSVSRKAPPPPPLGKPHDAIAVDGDQDVAQPRQDEQQPTKTKPPPLALVEPLVLEPPAENKDAADASQALSTVPGPPPAPLDLSSIEPFGDMPEETLGELQRSAERHVLACDEEVSGFGLAVVTAGEAVVTAIVNDVHAVRLVTGAVLRSRGTVDERVALRLVCVSAHAVILTWSEQDVTRHLEALPWVEEELRLEADRVHAMVGATSGPLGEEFDASVLQEVAKRFEVRQLLPGETLVNAGESVPGLVVLGVGELEVDGHPDPAIGDLLFPSALLSAGPAPASVRAGPRGAVVLWMGLSESQEMMMVFPPLLDLIARA